MVPTEELVLEANAVPYLLLSLSTEPEQTWEPVYLNTNPLCLGRPEEQQTGTGFVDLRLSSVSREHARIWQEDGVYSLENWHGRYGIGLFERDLQPGQRHELQHGYIFRVPNLTEHVRIMFVANSKETQLWPLYMEPALQKVYVFGRQVELSPQEYALLHYLYAHRNRTCPYNAIIDQIWPGLREKGVVQKGRNLDVLLANLRRALAAASGGFTFMQTVRGEGIRLVV
jgi:DNA-binding winged helix-turn-helix (wHTH) protein